MILFCFISSGNLFTTENVDSLFSSTLEQINGHRIKHKNLTYVEKHKSNLFGESIDLYSGTVVFKRNDAVLKGNSDLPMSYRLF